MSFSVGLRVFAVHSIPPPSSSGNKGRPDPFDRVPNRGPQYERANVRKGKSFSVQNRRRGRSACLRSPDDSPLRDGNRDRLIGLLTERAAKTLLVYLQETNPNVYHWLYNYLAENQIPLKGSWDEISGEVFLRKLLSMSSTTTKMEGRGQLYDNMATAGVEPRQIAQRIMDIRVQLSKEFVQDLGQISDENSILLRETLQVSLQNTLEESPTKLPPKEPVQVFIHPELLAKDGNLHPEVAKTHPELISVVQRQASPAPVSAENKGAANKGAANKGAAEEPPSKAA